MRGCLGEKSSLLSQAKPSKDHNQFPPIVASNEHDGNEADDTNEDEGDSKAEDEFEWLGYFQHTKESLSTTHSSDSDLFPADAFPMEMKTSRIHSPSR